MGVLRALGATAEPVPNGDVALVDLVDRVLAPGSEAGPVLSREAVR